LINKSLSIPLEFSQEKLIWKHVDYGDLVLKDAYQIYLPLYQDLSWEKLCWSPDIPLSKIFFG
jgi:hypothetical protein